MAVKSVGARVAHATSTRTVTIGRDVTQTFAARGRRKPARLTARHVPPPVSRLMPQTHGRLLDTTLSDGRQLSICISGDTLVVEGIHAIAKRFPRIDVGFVHLGGTRIPHRSIGILVTLDANGGIELLRILAPRTIVPVHNDDWSLFSSSLRDFLYATDAVGLRERVHVISRGETLDRAPFAKPA